MTATARVNISKTIAILIFIAAAATLIHPTFAQDATRSGTTRREAVQQKVDTRQENIENKMSMMKEKMASREAALKARLNAFKDKRKAEIAQRVNTNLNRVNQNQTNQMQNHLDRMSALLDKLETRVNQAAPDIKDPVTARTAIVASRAAIASASSAVSAQSQKDYTIVVTFEAQVKSDAQKMRDALKTDLMAVRKLVIGAKQSLVNVVKAARPDIIIKEGTSSGQQ